MKKALLNGKEVFASRGLKGAVCKGCGQEMIAKCGTKLAHHWAHQSGCPCDPWLNQFNETNWRSDWLNQFKTSEIEFCSESNGVKHFIDIRTQNGVNLMLREKVLTDVQIDEIENFLNNLVWIVRLGKNDQKRFKKNEQTVLQPLGNDDNPKKSEYVCINFDQIFPIKWGRCKYPIIFDVNCENEGENQSTQAKELWCVLPFLTNSGLHHRFVFKYQLGDFLKKIKKRLPRSKNEVAELVKKFNEEKADTVRNIIEKYEAQQSVFKKLHI